MKLAAAGAGIVAMLLAGCASNSGGGGMPSPSPPSPSSIPSPAPSLPSPPSTSPPSPSLPSPASLPAPTDSGSKSGGSATPEAPVPGTIARSGERGGTVAGTDSERGGESGSAQTPQERRAAVDGKLDASLGTFDEQLKREQQRTAQERDARASGRAGTAGTGGADSSGNGDEDAGGLGGVGNRSGRDRSGDLRSERRGGESADESGNDPGQGVSLPGRGGGGAVSGRVIPDGSDDDIIARRLRKAAEAETDPELKDKLWKEYT